MESGGDAVIPKRYLEMGFDNWDPPAGTPDPRPTLQRWAMSEERPWCIALLGNTGVGKTHLATATFVAWCGSRRFGWWLDAADAMATLRRQVIEEPERETLVANKLIDRRLLLVDDFGSTRLTEFGHEQWVRALLQRYNQQLPTIITSNALELAAFRVIDPRLESRLHDGLVLTLTGDDRRCAA